MVYGSFYLPERLWKVTQIERLNTIDQCAPERYPLTMHRPNGHNCPNIGQALNPAQPTSLKTVPARPKIRPDQEDVRSRSSRRRTREDRGAEGVGVGRGVPLPTGEGLGSKPCPLPRKKFYFGSQYGEFWCILNGIFLQFSYLFYTQNERRLL